MYALPVLKQGFSYLNIICSIVTLAFYVLSIIVPKHLRVTFLIIAIAVASFVRTLQYAAMIGALKFKHLNLHVSDILLFYFTHVVLFNSVINLNYLLDPTSYNFENSTVSGKKEDVDIPFDSFYFSVVQSTTLGFGDISPKTKEAKITTIIQSIDAYILFAFMITHIKELIGGHK